MSIRITGTAEHNKEKRLGEVEVKKSATIMVDGDPTAYKRWVVSLLVEKGHQIFDFHIKFNPKPVIKVKDDVLNPNGTNDDRIKLDDFPTGWTGSYDPKTGEISIEGPAAPGGNPGLDPNQPLRAGRKDFSFDFEPDTFDLGKIKATITFTDSQHAVIGTSDGTEGLK